MMKHSVLVVDDEKNILRAIERALRKMPITLLTATSGEEGLNLLSAREVSIVISDFNMPNMNGMEFLTLVSRRHPHILSIMLTGQAELEIAVQAINDVGVYKFIQKPWNDDDLRITLQRSLESIDIANERDRLVRKVKRRDTILADLERKFPGITKLDKDKDGYLHLDG